eukprot:scaffold14265_cov58-Phaeocystis_antarctica.AAC.4
MAALSVVGIVFLNESKSRLKFAGVTLCGNQGGLRPRPAGSPEAPFSARPCLRLPRASASLGQSAAWAALAGHIGLVFHIGVTSIIFGTICLSWADGQK